MTFRRSSTTPANQAQPSSETPTQASAGDNAAPLSVAALLADNSHRYTREQLLDVYRSQEPRLRDRDVTELYASGWMSGQVNGGSRQIWGKNDGHVPQDPGVCWDTNGEVKPIGLQDMTDEEKEVCYATSRVLFPCRRPPTGFGIRAWWVD
jgi:PERQ amino acid-rich with GYF domain-containing protein